MAAGVPVVATSAGAIPEVVGDGALLVDPGDLDGLAGAMARALDGGPAIGQLVKRGRARSGTFSWERCAEGLAALYGAAHRAAAPPAGVR
jgi:glycosyltransferase involved in cell wall biosynthesis